MFSREESKKLRQEFWIAFGKSFPRKWVLYNTGVKGFSFKFYFDTKKAMVVIDIEPDDLEERIRLYEKMESLKTVLTENYLAEAIFEDVYFLENGKEISRIYVIKEGVSIHNKNSWQETMIFLKDNMLKIEEFFEDFKDFIAK